MSIDDRQLSELIVESQDLQADALAEAKRSIPDLREIGAARRNRPLDLERIRSYEANRRSVLKKGGFGFGALAARGLVGTGFGAALLGIVARPAAAQSGGVDVQILQTASSLENLAVATYGVALTLPFIKDGNPVVKAFAETTMGQHGEHAKAFKAQTEALGGTVQDQPNAKYLQVVEDAKPTLTDPAKVVDLAIALEGVATQTYVANMALFEDAESKKIMASVMGVEAQHLATLRAVAALLAGGGAALIKIPTDVAALPAAAGSVAFPEPFEGTENASPPEEGAVK